LTASLAKDAHGAAKPRTSPAPTATVALTKSRVTFFFDSGIIPIDMFSPLRSAAAAPVSRVPRSSWMSTLSSRWRIFREVIASAGRAGVRCVASHSFGVATLSLAPSTSQGRS
jgi:hypothetical protein